MANRRPRRAAPAAAKGRKATFVIAGLPKAALEEAQAALEHRFPLVAFFGSPSRHADGALYSPEVVGKLLEEVAGFAIRRRRSAPPNQAWPATITLLYVPSADQEHLLSAFDFSVMPAPMAALEAYNEAGIQHRHDPKAVIAAAAEAMSAASASKQALDEVKQRVNRLLNDGEVLLLPPDNFHLGDRRLRALFDAYRRGDRAPTDRFPELKTVQLTKDDIKWLGGDVRHAHVDTRGNAFLNAHPTAYDGGTWEVDEAEAERTKLSEILRSLYRFGAALPDGFHHDVQSRDGSPFKNELFDCSRRGERAFTAQYVNIYPDDVVRLGKARTTRKGKK
ncbi:MAG: hypothetical protein Q7S93_11445 [Phenylobacterium sp.]|uniref:hypothetical protein n=1 Tax=Phenylobacterium sp. TaxID=1871053 RepID=UPI00272474CC|nr:hypothetical protein [Phenylobacterium sp.]MDO8410660.1 hypothetical protein [Phenylobacterium sp.]